MVLNDAQRIAKNKLKENNRRKRAAKEMEEGAERIENLLGPEHHTLVHYATAALVHMRSSLVRHVVILSGNCVIFLFRILQVKVAGIMYLLTGI